MLGLTVREFVGNVAGVVTDQHYMKPPRSTWNGKGLQPILQNLFVIEIVAPWYINRLKRITKSKKHYALNTGFISSILRTDFITILKVLDLQERLLDTSIHAQLRVGPSILATSLQIFTYATQTAGME